MTWRKILTAIALAAALVLPAASHADDDQVVAGQIEKVDKEGRLWVLGTAYVVTDDTEIFDQLHRTTKSRELVAGVPVEITYDSTAKGATAKTIIATLMR